MRGLDDIIAIRRSGMKPDFVSLDLPGIGQSSGLLMAGQVLVEEADQPERADLRALVGLRVLVMALSGCFDAAEAWARAVCRAGAADVGIAFLSLDSGLDGPVWIRVNGEQLA